MAVIDESVVMKITREDLRAFLRSTDNQTMWQSNLIELTKLDDGDPQLGTKYRGVVKVAGRKVEWTAEIVEWDDLAFYTLKTIEASIGFEMRYTFDEVPGGTKVTVHQEIAPFGGFFGKLADPVVTRMYARDVKANLGKLKDVMESGLWQSTKP
ncbi:SRPBCC family protein [Actinomycetota bacterium]